MLGGAHKFGSCPSFGRDDSGCGIIGKQEAYLFCSFAFARFVIFRLKNEAQKWTKQISRDISKREERMKSKQEERQQTVEKVQQTFL